MTSSLATPPSVRVSATILLAIAAVLLAGNALSVDLHALMVVALVVSSGAAVAVGHRWATILESMAAGVARAMPALFIFFLIGMLVGAWMLSGTIATLLNFGLEVVAPGWFLPMGVLACALVSLGTGTAWGTVGTVGVVLVGIGEGLGLPCGLVGGAIVSGATFGDKVSPVSDTTNLAAAASGAPLYEHIRGMLSTTLPTLAVCFVVYAALGVNAAAEGFDSARIDQVQALVNREFETHWSLLTPMVLLLGLSVKRVPPVPAMAAGIGLALCLAITVQGASVSEALESLNKGYVATTGDAEVDALLSRGGIQKMMWTFSLAILALALGGLLERLEVLRVLVDAGLSRVRRIGTVVAMTIGSGLLTNMVVGEAYLSIVLNGRLYHRAFRERGLADRMLSRCLEDGATLSTSLIPWTTSGAFVAGALGIAVTEYAPWAFFNWLNPLVSIALTYFGWTVFRAAVPAGLTGENPQDDGFSSDR